MPSAPPVVSRRRMLLGTAAWQRWASPPPRAARRRHRRTSTTWPRSSTGPRRQPAGQRRRGGTAAPPIRRGADRGRVRAVGACPGAVRRDRPHDRRDAPTTIVDHEPRPRPRPARRRRPPPRTSSPRCDSPPTAPPSWRPSCPATAPGCSARSPRPARRPTRWHSRRRRGRRDIGRTHARPGHPTPTPPRCSTPWPPSTPSSTATGWCRRTPLPRTTTWCRRRCRAPRATRGRDRDAQGARSVDPPLPAAGYQLPMQVDNPTDAANLAVRMEEDTAVAWRAVLEQATDERGPGVRGDGADADAR